MGVFDLLERKNLELFIEIAISFVVGGNSSGTFYRIAVIQ